MIEIDKYILNRTYRASPIFATFLTAAMMIFYVLGIVWIFISGKAFKNTGYPLVNVLIPMLFLLGGSVLVSCLIRRLYQTASLKIEFKKIYYSRVLPVRWKELDLQKIGSATFHSIEGRGGTLTIKANSINKFNEIEVPIWKESEGYRAADYINDLVTDYWKERSSGGRHQPETLQPGNTALRQAK